MTYRPAPRSGCGDDRSASRNRPPELRRVLVAAILGVAVALFVSLFVTVELAVLCGWGATALVFLRRRSGPVIVRADSGLTEELATREDLASSTARLLLLVASGASIVAVGLAISRARQEIGAERWTLVTIAAITVVLSWTVVNTIFLLRYTNLYYSSPPGVSTSPASIQQPGPTTTTSRTSP